MDPAAGHIDVRGAAIGKVVQVNVDQNHGGVSVPVTHGQGRTVMTIDHAATRDYTDPHRS
ncbi:MAG: hypothetical protein ACREJO_14980 [Phycisphaerales bacterium]